MALVIILKACIIYLGALWMEAVIYKSISNDKKKTPITK
jgi:hypothetical protein